MKTQLHILFTMLLSAGIVLLVVETTTAQQTLFTIEDAGGTVVLRVLDDGTVVAEKLDLQGGEGALQCTGCITSGRLGDDAVNTDNISDDAINSDKIADEAVQPAHIAGGVMNGQTRGSIYVRNAAGSIATFDGEDTVVARCDDPADLPVAGECYASLQNDVALKRFGPDAWENVNASAGYSCTYRSNTASTVSYQARIHCLDVTP